MYLEKYLEDHEVKENSQGHAVLEIAYSCEICNGSSLWKGVQVLSGWIDQYHGILSSSENEPRNEGLKIKRAAEAVWKG
jgi:hypothetical protein